MRRRSAAVSCKVSVRRNEVAARGRGAPPSDPTRADPMISSRFPVRVLFWAFVLSALSFTAGVQAQTGAYPAKAIRVIVPFPAGGLVDGMARTLMPEIGRSIGQSIVVDNRGGASGSIGAAAVAQSAPD